MEITDEQINSMAKDWVEDRMPTKEQQRATSTLINYAMRFKTRDRQLTRARLRELQQLADQSFAKGRDSTVTMLEDALQEIAPEIGDEWTLMLYEQLESSLKDIKRNEGPITEDQQKLIMTGLHEAARQHE